MVKGNDIMHVEMDNKALSIDLKNASINDGFITGKDIDDGTIYYLNVQHVVFYYYKEDDSNESKAKEPLAWLDKNTGHVLVSGKQSDGKQCLIDSDDYSDNRSLYIHSNMSINDYIKETGHDVVSANED